MPTTNRQYPGSRWWKFDFHTHTPASEDTDAWQAAKGTPEEITPRKWLLKYMAAEIDCVAVTDHNSGAWIDRLQKEYEAMRLLADQGLAPEGFRQLSIFPGVEISVHGGIHILAIFDPSNDSTVITSLLGAVGFPGHLHGATDSRNGAAVTRNSCTEVLEKILHHGGIPIPAHADKESGLLLVKPGTRACAHSANSVIQALEVDGLLAVEWCDLRNPLPEIIERRNRPMARVLGSDCHSFRGQHVPGSRFTWVKMAQPTLEGLRLALLDGNGIAIRRSAEGDFDPLRVPFHLVRSIEIENARAIGNGQPARLAFSPYFNAVVGGRGTGKSTIVHALRLAARRESELQDLPKNSEPRERFDGFRNISNGRDDTGALRAATVFRVEWQHEDRLLRLSWHAESKGPAIEELRDGEWHVSSSQSVSHERFPIRIFSQGQIAAMAGPGRPTLLRIIDESAGMGPLKQALEEARRTFLAQRARLREIDGKLGLLPEVERRFQEAETKLQTLSRSDQSATLQAFSRAQHQQRAVDEVFRQLQENILLLRKVADGLLLDDWLPQHYSDQDADLLAWRADTDVLMATARSQLEQQAQTLKAEVEQLGADPRLTSWRGRATDAIEAHQALQQRLVAQGVADPQAFARLSQQRQQLEAELKALRRLQADRVDLLQQIERQEALVLEHRRAITQCRQAFLDEKLARNDYVRMRISPFGLDPIAIERSLREVIDITDDRFAEDIERLSKELAQTTEKQLTISRIREQLLHTDSGLHGRFRNYLTKRWEKPEWADHLRIWYPEDDLQISYRRNQEWPAISEGSQGQRSAALLAFLLAFGEEPLVLDQPEDDLDNHLIYDLIVQQIRENKLRRQLIIVTHNPNIVVNGDAELVHVMDFGRGQCIVKQSGALQEGEVREEVCRVMEGGREAFSRRWKRLGRKV